MSAGVELRRLEVFAAEAGAPELAAELHALAERTSCGRFFVACVGQTKRGKSTLLNALVGQDVLPTGILPVTAIPTVLRYGEPAVRVAIGGDEWRTIAPGELVTYVAEEHNPGNRKGVLAVEVFLLCPLLHSGLSLVDTPGLSSVFETNTAVTRDFVPQIDAAIVVLGPDPPISKDELDLVQTVAAEVDSLVVVLNKADRMPSAERKEVVGFTERVLRERLRRPIPRILEVSALAAARRRGELRDWEELVTRLRDLADESGGRLVDQAVRRGVRRLGGRLHWLLGEHRSALVRPIAESERRLRQLDSLADASARALRDLRPLYTAEQQRISCTLSTRHQEFVERAFATGLEQLHDRLEAFRSTGVRLTRARARDLTNEIARGLITPWLKAQALAFEEIYREVSESFGQIARVFLQRLATSTETDVSLGEFELDPAAFPHRGPFYFHDLLHRHAPPLSWAIMIDAILPERVAARRVDRTAESYLGDLLVTNASRVRADIEERVTTARERHETEIGRVLTDVRAVSMQAAERGKAVQAQGEQFVRSEVTRLDKLRAEVQRLIQDAENTESAVGDSLAGRERIPVTGCIHPDVGFRGPPEDPAASGR
jgi:GTP-binding protein EngB required for normal cell division